MHRRAFFTLAIAVTAGVYLSADTAAGDPRLARLFELFVSPCCWREHLLVHQCPGADELVSEDARAVSFPEVDLE
jgi:hypothetical protein